MKASIWQHPNGRRGVGWSGVDGDPSSRTVGMVVCFGSREFTVGEKAEHDRLCAALKAAPVNPRAGEKSYGDIGREYQAWVEGLPRAASKAVTS